MGEEIETTEAPKWVKELEARREHRLKARLGHEAGAGAPCRTCNEQCPGLDLHFWRKICKNCKCAKEDHDVHDDDIYGWAQHELLGSKPNKIRSKIVLPGKKDEVELEWTPMGQKDTVDKFLKTLPPEQLPVKGSQAAQDRKQMLQKQIPIHDIDPSLCHELTESELKQMNEYIAHMKQNSVGVGKVIQIGAQHGTFHTLGPKDGLLVMQRYPKEIPSSELVKLQGQSSANALNKKLVNMSLDQNPDRNSGQNYLPNASAYSDNVTPCDVGIRDIRAPIYVEDGHGCRMVRPGEHTVAPTNTSGVRDVNYPVPGPNSRVQRQVYNTEDVEVFDPSKLLPQNLPNIGVRPSEMYQKPYNPNLKTRNYPYYEQDPSSLESGGPVTSDFTHGSPKLQRNIPNYGPNSLNILESSQHPRNQALKTEQYPQYVAQENAINANQMVQPPIDSETTIGNIARGDKTLPHFVPGKYNTYRDTQSPVKIGNLKDLAFSTYDPEKLGSGDDIHHFNDANRNKLNPQCEGVAPNQYYDDQSPMRTILRQKYGDFNQNKLPENDLGGYDQYGEPLSYGKNTTPIREAYDKFGKPIEQNTDTISGNEFIQNKNQESGITGFDKYGVPLPYRQDGAPKEGSDKFGRRLGTSIRTMPEEERSYNQNVPGTETVGTLGPRANKPLPHLNPMSLHMTENKRDPLQVNVGSINDIVYQMPEIKSAASEENPLHQRYRAPEPFATISDGENLPACHRCKKLFTQNEFAIQIEQNNALFHPGCLKCAGCNQILADMFYFYDNKSNEVYCLRDYAKIRGIPRCKACDELIFVKEYTLAENNTFHIKHFCCFECDEPLAGQNYIMEDSQPVCLPCYEKLKANHCRACTSIIRPDEQGANLKGVHFHATDACFACKVCKKPLLGAKLMFKNETLYCSPDCYVADQ